MQLGRFLGIFIVFIGLVFSWFAVTMLRDAGFTLRLLAAGPGLVIVGLAFIVFPGGNMTLKESRAKTKDPQVVFREAPGSHKVAWGVAVAIGAVITIMVLN